MCYFWLGDIYAHVQDMKRAKACYLKAYAHTKNASCLYQLALAYKKSGQTSQLAFARQYAIKAIQAYEDTIGNKCPQVISAYELLAKIYI